MLRHCCVIDVYICSSHESSTVPLPNRDLHRLQASTNGNESHLQDLLPFDLDMWSETEHSLNDAKCRWSIDTYNSTASTQSILWNHLPSHHSFTHDLLDKLKNSEDHWSWAGCIRRLVFYVGIRRRAQMKVEIWTGWCILRVTRLSRWSYCKLSILMLRSEFSAVVVDELKWLLIS